MFLNIARRFLFGALSILGCFKCNEAEIIPVLPDSDNADVGKDEDDIFSFSL